MNDREFAFSTFQDIARQVKGRQVVLCGSGNIADKTIRKLTLAPGFIVDNSANLWETDYQGLRVRNPECIRGISSEVFAVICRTSYAEVGAQLTGYGFKPGLDFVVSPILNDLRIIDELESVERTLLVTSGGQPDSRELAGGGLYELVVSGLSHEIRKVLSGSFHSVVREASGFITVDDERGIIRLNDRYQIVDQGILPQGIRAHGLSYHNDTETYFVACSRLDKVLRLDAGFQIVQEYALSRKADSTDMPAHHTNDCLVLGNSLYVSMFSATGNWKRDVFDGAVVEFDIESGEKIGMPIQDLWMPHNIGFVDGSLTVLDSLRGGLRRNNAQVCGQFPAFTRGLAHDGEYFYIGQSRNRNFSKALGVSNNISIDTAVVIFDEKTKVSRSIQLPSAISEIHGIEIAQ